MEIINQNGAFILFLVIVFLVWVASKYEPKLKLKIAEVDILDQVKRLEADFENARDLEQLDRLEKFIDVIHNKAKSVVKDPEYFSNRLYRSYWNKHWDLVNTDYQGLPQSLIPFLTLK